MGKNRNQTRRTQLNMLCRNKRKRIVNNTLRTPLTPFQLRLVDDSKGTTHPMYGWPTAIIVLVCEWRSEMNQWDKRFNLTLRSLHDCYFAQKELANISISCRRELISGGVSGDTLDLMMAFMGTDKLLVKGYFDTLIKGMTYTGNDEIDKVIVKMCDRIQKVQNCGYPEFQRVMKNVHRDNPFIDYETTQFLEKPRAPNRCVICDVEFCACTDHRCKGKQATLECGCNGWCQGCIVEHSRNHEELHCEEESCSIRMFKCLRCYDTLYFDTHSNEDRRRLFWGPVTFGVNGNMMCVEDH